MLDIGQNIDFYCKLKGVNKLDIAEYLAINESTFYRRIKSNNWYLSDIEKLADFFGVPLLDFLQQKTSLSYAMEAPAPYAAKSKEAQIEGLKKEVAYLKKIVELMEKSKRLK